MSVYTAGRTPVPSFLAASFFFTVWLVCFSLLIQDGAKADSNMETVPDKGTISGTDMKDAKKGALKDQVPHHDKGTISGTDMKDAKKGTLKDQVSHHDKGKISDTAMKDAKKDPNLGKESLPRDLRKYWYKGGTGPHSGNSYCPAVKMSVPLLFAVTFVGIVFYVV